MSGHKPRLSLLGGQPSGTYQPIDHQQLPAGGYHDRQGLVPTPAKAQSVTARNMYIPSTTWTWSFMMVTIAQAAIGLTLEGYTFGEFQGHLKEGFASQTSAKTIDTYLSLFIFGFLYQIALAWDALRLSNTIQVIGLCLYNLGLLIYAAVQTDQIHDAVNDLASGVDDGGQVGIQSSVWFALKPYLVAVPCVIALGTCILSAIAWKLYDEFAWSIYKNISADLRMKRRFLVFQVYIALLKFDFFFFVSFSVQFLVVVSGTSHVETALTLVVLILTVPVLFLAGYWTRRESVYGMCVVIFFYFCALAYFLFKLVRMYDSSDPLRVEQYLPARRGLTTFAIITIFLIVMTIGNAAWCTMNFGQGLKAHVYRKPKLDSESKAFSYDNSIYNGGVPLGQVSSRMTID